MSIDLKLFGSGTRKLNIRSIFVAASLSLSVDFLGMLKLLWVNNWVKTFG